MAQFDVQEAKHMLSGRQINSHHYDGCVYFDEHLNVYMNDEVIDTINTKAKYRNAINEMFYHEFATHNLDDLLG